MARFALSLICVFLMHISVANTLKYKILIITGGHDFEEEEFFEMFDSFKGINYDTISQPEANKLLKSKMVLKYSCLVFYDMIQDISVDQKAAFENLLEQGMDMVFLHHSLVSYQKWPEFQKIIGGKYHLKSSDDHAASTYRHDVDIHVKIVDSKDNHPITSGMDDFMIHDEVYGNYSVSDAVIPFIVTDHPESTNTIGWWHQYKNAKVVYIQSGHDHHAYENKNYRQLVERAIYFVSHNSEK